jgi:hypothetical protein
MIAGILFARWTRRSQMCSAFINAREGGDAVALGLKPKKARPRLRFRTTGAPSMKPKPRTHVRTLPEDVRS